MEKNSVSVAVNLQQNQFEPVKNFLSPFDPIEQLNGCQQLMPFASSGSQKNRPRSQPHKQCLQTCKFIVMQLKFQFQKGPGVPSPQQSLDTNLLHLVSHLQGFLHSAVLPMSFLVLLYNDNV